jgi:DNA-binding response OmpR family regulator
MRGKTETHPLLDRAVELVTVEIVRAAALRLGLSIGEQGGVADPPPARAVRRIAQNKPAQLPPPKAIAGANGGGKTSHGVTVCLDPDAESIFYGGRLMELTPRQARLAAALAAGMPNPIDRKFLIGKVFGAAAPEFADTLLGQLARQLNTAAAACGLIVKTVRGVGIALQAAE